jgi:hypothetical protein
MLGNVRASQENFVEALDLHERAHNQFLSSLGRNHYRVAGILYSLAEHAERAGDLQNARSSLIPPELSVS